MNDNNDNHHQDGGDTGPIYSDIQRIVITSMGDQCASEGLVMGSQIYQGGIWSYQEQANPMWFASVAKEINRKKCFLLSDVNRLAIFELKMKHKLVEPHIS